MPDNSAALAEFARQRHAAAIARTVEVLRLLEVAGGTVTYAAVAKAANVSRAWLYTQPDIRAVIDDLRSRSRISSDSVPVRQQASDASLLRRLTQAHQRARDLDAEVRLLRQQLAAAHGELRAARSATPVRAL